MPDLAASSPRPGVFISVEGIDGAGKSTHVPLMVALLQAQGWTVCQTREPGGTPLAERLRELVLHEPMDALTEALLVFAARREHITRRIAPALARGEAVLSDRFTDATFAYQGGGRGFDWATLALLESAVQGGSDPRVDTHPAPSPGAAGALLQPDLTLWFDLDPAVAAERLAQARTPDRFEALSADFFKRVREGYLQRAQAMPDRFVRIDASGRAEAVAERVESAMQQFLNSWTAKAAHA